MTKNKVKDVNKAILKILNEFSEWESIVIGDEPREKLIFKHKRLKLLGFKSNKFILKMLKNKLLENQKAEFVRMTGSGSTLVVYFRSKVLAKKALKMYKRELNKCWCILSKII